VLRSDALPKPAPQGGNIIGLQARATATHFHCDFMCR
jgi:hypothetical protein